METGGQNRPRALCHSLWIVQGTEGGGTSGRIAEGNSVLLEKCGKQEPRQIGVSQFLHFELSEGEMAVGSCSRVESVL